MGSLTYAYASSIIGTTLAQPSFIQYFAFDTRSNAADLAGAINGVFQAGGLIGALACIPIADNYGRRIGLFVASLLAVIGGALQAGSVNIAMYITMRLISGFAVGEYNVFPMPMRFSVLIDWRCIDHSHAIVPR